MRSTEAADFGGFEMDNRLPPLGYRQRYPTGASVGFIEINGKRFSVDTERSGISATIEAGSHIVSISISVNALCHETDDFDTVSMNFAFAATDFKSGWESLALLEIRFDNNTQRSFILPDDPATVYLGWHLFATNNHLRFAEMENGGFRINWTCRAVDFPDDQEGYDIKIDGWIPIACVNVNFPELFKDAIESVVDDTTEALELAFDNLNIDVPKSIELLSQRFNKNEYSNPNRLRWGLSFPYCKRGITTR